MASDIAMGNRWRRADGSTDGRCRVRGRSETNTRKRSEEHTSELQSHSDLHSFPTRRSSDLEFGRVLMRHHRHVGDADGVVAVADLGLIGIKIPMEWHQILRWEIVGDARTDQRTADVAFEVGLKPIPGKDRKSTRLNSSHTVIYTPSLHDALPILNSGAC